MKKPIKPRKPSKSELAPQKIVVKDKLLVLEEKTRQYLLIDPKSHPDVFPDGKCLNPNGNVLEELGYNSDACEIVSFFSQQVIFSYLRTNFSVAPQYNHDGYYDCTIVRHETENENYEQELKDYENRFNIYEEALSKYTKELDVYLDFQKQQKKQKLLKELGELE